MAQTEQKGVKSPSIKDLLKAGVQFGHETRRWNPSMAEYIFGAKNNIHVIDIAKTEKLLADATEQIGKLAQQGSVLFIGTKRQASKIVEQAAVDSGSFFMINRWVGGFFTNLKQSKRSLKRLVELETMFETGVEGRTKFEIAKMKTEWTRLNRLYAGVKQMEQLPVAVVVVDPRYEAAAVKESRNAGIPVFALADTNCDPRKVDYIIPGNDDAIGSIELVVNTLAASVKANNGGKGIKHDLRDYSKFEVKIIKRGNEQPVAEKIEKVRVSMDQVSAEEPKVKNTKKSSTSEKQQEVLEQGILGKARSK